MSERWESGSSSEDSEGYPSTFCPVVSDSIHLIRSEFYGDMKDPNGDDVNQLYNALREELEEFDDDLDDVNDGVGRDEFSDDFCIYKDDLGKQAFVSEYNSVAPLCDWSQEARDRKKELMYPLRTYSQTYLMDSLGLGLDWFLDRDSFEGEALLETLGGEFESGGNVFCSTVYAAIDPLEDKALYEEAQDEADDDFAIALQRLQESTDDFRRVLRKYGTVTNYTMAHRCGSRYMRVQQPAPPTPRQPATWTPTLLHTTRARVVRSSGIMHTLLRKLSLFNLTAGFAQLNTLFVNSIARRCCSTLMVEQLHAQFEQHLECRIAAGSQ
jgi:hypothetical protein